MNIRPAHLVAPLMAMSYPFALMAFHYFVTAPTAGSGTAARSGAAVSLLIAFATPFVALLMALRFSRQPAYSVGASRARRVAYLVVAAPPLFTLIGVLVFMAGNPVSDILIYCVIWAALILAIFMGGTRPVDERAAPAPKAAVRVSHGAIAIGVFALFLIAHIANHLFGLAGADAHRAVMKILRHVYRDEVVEPVLLLGFLYLIGSGAVMAWRHTGEQQDGFRVFQVASGIYLLFFLIGHINAVLILARSFLGIDSDWGFATGAPTGLIHDAWNIRLVPLYALAVFSALGHPLLGARVVMLAHGGRRELADGLVFAGGTLAAVVATTIVLGMCGLRLRFV